MLDGRSRRAIDFLDLIDDLNIKTLRRDLEGLASVPELQISAQLYRGVTYWRMDAKLVPDPITRVKEKYCAKCDEIKPIEEFNKQRGTVDGYKSACSVCTSRMKREWSRENRKHINAYRRRKRKSANRRGVKV